MSSVNTYTGRVVYVGEVQTFGTFSKCEVVLSDGDDKYPQEVPFSFGGKASDLPADEQIQVGDTVTVSYNLKGRSGGDKWPNRWFGEISAWKLIVNERAEPVTSVVDEDVVLDEEDESPPF